MEKEGSYTQQHSLDYQAGTKMLALTMTHRLIHVGVNNGSKLELKDLPLCTHFAFVL